MELTNVNILASMFTLKNIFGQFRKKGGPTFFLTCFFALYESKLYN